MVLLRDRFPQMHCLFLHCPGVGLVYPTLPEMSNDEVLTATAENKEVDELLIPNSCKQLGG